MPSISRPPEDFMTKRFPVPLRVLAVLVLVSVACSVSSGHDVLPPTDTPEANVEPSPTPEGGGVPDDGFFILNLSESDQEGLVLRAEEIYQSILNTGGEIDRGTLLDA